MSSRWCAVPIGTGIIYAGMNDARVHDNWIFDNWRDGHDAVRRPRRARRAGPRATIFPGDLAARPRRRQTTSISTSCDNQLLRNHMGQVPPDFEPHPGADQFGNEHEPRRRRPTAPNGIDFWWDEFTVNTGNCWFDNTGSDGTEGAVTGDPATLPSNCGTSIGGPAYSGKAPILLACYAQWETKELDGPGCSWWNTPPQPDSAAARAELRATRQQEKDLANSEDGRKIEDWVDELAGELSYGPTH